MLGLLGSGELVLYRRGTHGECLQWARVVGDEEKLAKALESAREIEAEISAIGGWTQALRLGKYAHEPRKAGQVITGVFAQNPLNSPLGKVKIAGRLDSPGPVWVTVQRWRVATGHGFYR